MKVVFSTVADMQTARDIAKSLVEKRVAACVNIVPGVLSVYEWQGKIEEDKELLLIIKTNNFQNVQNVITQMHPYDVPEIIAMDIADIDEKYLSWMQSVLVE
ncbi:MULTISPECIES: divalent-cation tolerance protein CutA [unclassified Nitratiruptor]|uniref:divalent-cation tolerance protein CutA n=1 Tax=unclassified Nitratiruptor TaxID=2624044 RepID=UPI001916881A|nr:MULTISPECIES: divalent-cation tolerance protein CutA [unclassified Nitratiruptor]BCD60243.1 periplasmic divalent cation tolerance protein [Nitratiruptor sp. YY08-10]BCD64268.1 periplasmic divalent cation tolerance protein [Nitratiruptor sp. YY08-14]